MDGGQPSKRTRLIHQYFTKIQPGSSTASSLTEQPPSVTSNSSKQELPAATSVTSSVMNVLSKSNDIGRVFKNSLRNTELVRKLSDYEKQELLTNHWLPGEGFITN